MLCICFNALTSHEILREQVENFFLYWVVTLHILSTYFGLKVSYIRQEYITKPATNKISGNFSIKIEKSRIRLVPSGPLYAPCDSFPGRMGKVST